MKTSIAKQFLLVGLIIVFAFTGLNIYTYLQIKEVENQYRQALTQDAPLVAYAKEAVGELWSLNAQTRGYLLTGDPKYRQSLQDSKQRLRTAMTAIEQAHLSPDAEREFNLLVMVITEYEKALDTTINMRSNMGIESAIKYMNAGGDKVDAIGNVTYNFIKVITDEMTEITRQSEEKIARLQLIMIVIDVIIFAAAVGVLLIMSRRIGRPLSDVVQAANRIADGDFRSQQLAYQRNDEIGDLISAFSAMSTKLRDLIREITGTSEQVAASSEQLTASAEQSAIAAGQVAATVTSVAAGTVTQVSAVEQTVAVVKQMADAINHIATSAANVSASSGETARAADAGSQAVAEATAQMQVINASVSQSADVVRKLGESSKQIGEIVDVISGIAGQTNLLALNAAIEAARAGEQGRGFAVVAEEVRKLAEQSQEAAGKIADIIREIQGETDIAVTAMDKGTVEVARGTEVIAQTGERFKHIVDLVQKLNSQIKEISTAASGLSASSKEVVASVDSVKAVASETAGSSETISAAAEQQSSAMQEIAASSQELSRMAENLQNAVSKFRL